MAAQWLKIDRNHDAPAVAIATQVLCDGGVVALATETVYGLVSRADSPAAVKRLRHLRGGAQRAMTLHVGKAQQAEPFVEESNAYARHAMDCLWPGPVSIVVKASAQAREVCEKQGIDPADVLEHGSVTIRCPSHSLARRVLGDCPHPIIGAAAPESPTRADDLPDAVRRDVDLVLDDGATALGKPSTVISVHRDHFDIVRPGVYDRRIIEKMLQTTILFVCSGNTCRSPMAQAIARKTLSDWLKVPQKDLASAGYTVTSAGVSAFPGLPAADHAIEVVSEMGGEIGEHRSRTLTRQLIDQSSVIFAMSRGHLSAILAVDPSAQGKTLLLDPDGDIADPIGGDLPLYKSVASKIKGLIERRLADRTLLRREK